jgi:23S rRNA A2030 N6-methylase RlmJ
MGFRLVETCVSGVTQNALSTSAWLKWTLTANPMHTRALILTDPSYKKATLLEVKDPRKELPKILEPLPDDSIAYWRIVREDEERRKVMAGLTTNPIFDDILG